MIDAAVNWWGAALYSPKFQTLSVEERMSGNPENDALATADWLNARYRKDTDPQWIERFKAALRGVLQGDPVDYTDWNGTKLVTFRAGGNTLSVDYGPDFFLHAAADRAGPGWDYMTTFPPKTTMWLKPETQEVWVRYGAGATRKRVRPDGTSESTPQS